jgi:iron complex transport system substrate-binding protein
MRICSFVPSATELLYALGVGDELVGVSHECDYPPEARRKPRVSQTVIDQERASSGTIDRTVRDSLARGASLYRVDELLLRRLHPDLVLTQKLCEVCAISDAQAERAVGALPGRPDVIALHAHTLEEMLEEVRLIGERTGTVALAETLIQRFRARLASLYARLAAVTSLPRDFCLEWLEPPMAAGHWVPEMVALAGGTEVLGRAGEASRYVTWDEIEAAAPEVLVLMPCGFSIERTRRELPLLTAQPAWVQLPAVRAGRVHLVDGSAYFNRCGLRAVDGIELLAGLFHPEQCADLIPAASAAPAA